MGTVIEVQHTGLMMNSPPLEIPLIFFFKLCALFQGLMWGLKKGFSLVSPKACITQDFSPADHRRAI